MTGHGGTNILELNRLGLAETDILDLSVNVVPFEIPQPIQQVLHRWDPRSYPDPYCIEARNALAERFQTRLDQVVLGNGATELMWTFFDALKPRGVLVLEPTFSEFRAAATAKGVPLAALHDPSGHWAGVEKHLADADLVYFTHPNNPTGRAMSLDRVEDWAERYPESLFLSDESFVSLSEAFADLDRRLPNNVVRLRSLTKDFGLAGLRVGYAIAPKPLVRRVDEVRPPWTVNSLAQAVVPAALTAETGLEEVRRRLFRARAQTTEQLRSAGFDTLESSTIYLMVRVGEASKTKDRMLQNHRIRVRDCTNFGLPEWIRVAAREGDTPDRLVRGLTQAV